MKKERAFFNQQNLMMILFLVAVLGLIFIPNISLANTTADTSLAGFEKFKSYLDTGLKFFKWAAAVFGGILLIFAFIEFMADNTQVTRLITKLVVCVFCLGLAFGVDKFMTALGGNVIKIQKQQIEKIEKGKTPKIKISNFKME